MLQAFFRQQWRGLTLVILLLVGFAGVLLSQTLRPSTAAVLADPTAVIAIAEAEQFDQPILPLPLDLKLNPAKVNLGQQLFQDTQLSRSGQMSCATCHNIQQGGDDGVPQSIGSNGKPVEMNSPTVLNSAFNFRQFWDGRVLTLEEQVGHPLESATEMNLSWDAAIAKLRNDTQYPQQFATLYQQQGITRETVSDAIATFQRSLITPSRFDRFLRGDSDALSKKERIGYEKFQTYGCVGCHQGVNLGGNMFQRLGTLSEYSSQPISQATNQQTFKVPTLRNITLTAPYLHDGSIETLPEVIQLMAQLQLGRDIPATDVDDIVAFLQSLTGELPDHIVAPQQTTQHKVAPRSEGT